MGEFIKYLEDVKRYSPNTLLAYKKDILLFVDYCKETEMIDDWKSVTPKMVRRWEVSMMASEKPVSPKTVRRRLSALSTLFVYMMRNGQVDDNPVKMVVLPKIPKRLPVFVSPEQMDTLLDGDSFIEEEFAVLRDKTVILMAYITGMRRSELVSLTLSDVDRSSKVIRVHGKGNKERIVPMTEELFDILNEYLKSRETLVGGKHQYLFVTDNGTPVYDKFIYRMVVRYLGMVTTQKKRSPHVLRHSFATALLNNGACIEAIRKLLGHSDLSATQVYTHTSVEGLKRIYNQAHPRAEQASDDVS
ncbi:MAG: tyrosine-type recombinase/integrase [Bacteroidaceae bacterium]|nr:tyrosine-type recombinase/integrase [Bacteroidaceae bacterium]